MHTSATTSRLILLLSVLLAPACKSAAPSATTTTTPANPIQLGVAVKTGETICLSLRGNNELPLKSLVTLITPSYPQSTVTATVLEHTQTPCPGIKDDQSAYLSYQLHLTPRRTIEIEDNMPLIAAVAPLANFQKVRETVQAHFPGQPQPSTFRSCTSADGVHLTVWQGKPLQGKRIWHQYYYLGQDLEPNCTDKDTAQ